MTLIDATVERFYQDDDGFHRPGDSLALASDRFADLRANGLVSAAALGQKMRASLDNKMAPEPENKEDPEVPRGSVRRTKQG